MDKRVKVGSWVPSGSPRQPLVLSERDEDALGAVGVVLPPALNGTASQQLQRRSSEANVVPKPCSWSWGLKQW
jgi:hypothetical protein